MGETRVERVNNGQNGAFVVHRGADRLAEMTWSRVPGEACVRIEHTWVSDDLRGLGIARKLLDDAIAWAREEDVAILPICPYAKAQFEKDPSICDVLRRD